MVLRTLQRRIVFAENTSWEEQYMRTLLEVNAQKMQERITATRQAIAGRLWDPEHDIDHHPERHKDRGCAESPLRTGGWQYHALK